MKNTPQVCIIGDIVTDVTLKTSEHDIKMRLGGIIHAARGLWAIDISFAVGYIAPEYLDKQIEHYLSSLGCTEILKIGNIIGAPYVFLIEEAKETGNQGYDFLLRNQIEIQYNESSINSITQFDCKDYLLISGNYDLSSLINKLQGNIHVDVANNIQDFEQLKTLQKKVTTLFVSTSSDIFKKYFNNDYQAFVNMFEPYCERMILKENRGGSRAFDFSAKQIISIGAQTTKVLHSIGVGDVYNSIYTAYHEKLKTNEALVLASWIATEYALTTYPDDFKTSTQRVLKSSVTDLINTKAVSLPWEKRSAVNIYIAAPDFDFVDRQHINTLFENLTYHNFNPRRPIMENGQMPKDATKAQRRKIFTDDMQLLDECSILIAVLLYNDPGTLIEIGLAAERKMPTLVYDPLKIATNCMLTELPDLVTSDLDEIISEVFFHSANITRGE